MNSRLLTLLFTTILLAGCFAKGPSDVIESFHTRVEAGKLDSAIELLSSQTRSQLSPAKLKQALQKTTQEIDSKKGIKKVEVIEEKIIGETAEVTVKIHFGDETELTDKNSLIMEDGEWRIQPTASGK